MSYWPDCSCITPREWNKLFLDKVRSQDFANVQADCEVTQAVRQYAQLKTTLGPVKYLMRHDRHPCSFCLQASCLGLQATVEHGGPMPTTSKMVFYATLVSQKPRAYFLLKCAAFAHERKVFWT
jgi:hypothetical protein